MSNRFLLPGFRAPKPQRYGIRAMIDGLEPGSPHWQHDGVMWEQVCIGAGQTRGAGSVPCDTSPMAGYVSGSVEVNVGNSTSGATGEGFDAFFAYAMLECGMIGGQDHAERARIALEVNEDEIVADRLLREAREYFGTATDTSLPAKDALGMALNGKGAAFNWLAYQGAGDPIVFMTHNVAVHLDLKVSENGKYLELQTGEKVYIFRDRYNALGQVDDADPGHIILFGGIAGIEGDIVEHLVPVTGVTDDTAEFNNDHVALAMRPWMIGFDCYAVWYRVQGLGTEPTP